LSLLGHRKGLFLGRAESAKEAHAYDKAKEGGGFPSWFFHLGNPLCESIRIGVYKIRPDESTAVEKTIWTLNKPARKNLHTVDEELGKGKATSKV
jgi:hypothetical protein